MSRDMSKHREELVRELEAESRKSTLDGVYFFQAVAQRSGMSLTDLQCIAILTSTGPLPAGQLAEKMDLTTGAVTGVINRMERVGYVRRGKDSSDGRRVVVQPVLEELERAGAGFFGSQEGALDALVLEYDDRDLAVFLDLMRKSNAVTREETAILRAASEGVEGGFASPMEELKCGRLVFAHGASRLTLRVEHGMDDLYRASFEGAVPKIKVEDGVVSVSRSRRHTIFDPRRHSEEFTLNASVPWEIEVRGGAVHIDADFGELELSSFVLKGGVVDLDLTLPQPSGVVPIRLSGGVSKVSVHRPKGVEARMSVKGGVSKLSFDEQSFDALGGKVQLQSRGYAGAVDRYEIDVSGGAVEITVR